MSKTVEQIWTDCLVIIKDSINAQSYKTWFEPIKPVKYEANILTIQVPSQFFYEWLEEHYVNLLSKTIKSVLGSGVRLEYRIVIENQYPSGKQKESTYAYTAANKESETSPTQNIQNPFVIPGIKKMPFELQLNPNYTFEAFIEGECNQLARSAGIAVANKPGGTAFNPLVLYGGVGLGKTHLIQAIGNQIKRLFPNKSILYVSSEKFTHQFIEAVRNNTLNDFVRFYQMVDVLLIDDIQFFAEKDKTQDIFFHVFNHLHQSGKQIVMTSDCAPKDMVGMEERLLSRFKWGLIADLQMPDFETRMAILEYKMLAEGIELPKEVVEYVAYNVSSSVRELEGVLISLVAHASLAQRRVDLNLAKTVIKTHNNNSVKDLSIPFIQKTVADYFHISIDILKGQTRKREAVQARQIAMYFVKTYTNYSLKQIGRDFGGRDHSTVIHSCQAVSDQIDTDPVFERTIKDLDKTIKMNI
ncbi:MAG: chromosomal replication initiator protein DnaA [Sphingobacteriales bacterium]|nr:chromosomal replication initiator protein DnaA [Sphingobacteriales bacterium]